MDSSCASGEILLFDGAQVLRLTLDDARDYEPDVSGTHVAWKRGFPIAEILVHDGVATRVITSNVAEDSEGKNRPALSGSSVAWLGYARVEGTGLARQIFVHDGVMARQITSDGLGKERPAISGPFVVWEAAGSQVLRQLYRWDGVQIRQLTQHTQDVLFKSRHFSVSGPRVAWAAHPWDPPAPVLLFDGAATHLLAEEGTSAETSASRVVWELDGEIFLHDGVDGVQLTRSQSSDQGPRVSESHVLWQEVDSDGEVYVRQQGSTTRLTDDDGTDVEPAGSGVLWAWSHDDGNDFEIRLFDGVSVRQLTDDAEDDVDPAVAGSRVAWIKGLREEAEVFTFDGAQTTQITHDARWDRTPQVSELGVTWRSCASYEVGPCELMLHDGQTTRRLAGEIREQVLDDDRVAWTSCSDPDRGCLPDEVHVFDGLETRTLDDAGGLHAKDLRVSTLGVAWLACDEACEPIGCFCVNGGVRLWDGETVHALTGLEVAAAELQMNDSLLAWTATDGADRDVFSCDGETPRQITRNDRPDSQPRLVGDRVAWRGFDGNDFEIFLAPEPALGWLRGVAAALILALARAARARSALARGDASVRSG
jgi:hypothetical protein